MLTIDLAKYAPSCLPNSGGISRVWLFDPADMDWGTSGTAGTYDSVALVSGATLIGGSGFFPVIFDYLEGEYKAPFSVKGSSTKWAHSLTLQLAGSDTVNSAPFFKRLQQAIVCGSVGVVFEEYNGSIKVLGESVVNGEKIPLFKVMMADGTEEHSGKAMDDPNGFTLALKGDYVRPSFSFAGGVAAIEALLVI